MQPDATPPDYDIIIAGAGPAGASLALALAPLPLRVALVEPRDLDQPAPPGERSFALSHASRRILEGIGIWPQLDAQRIGRIRRVHVSQGGRPGRVRLDAHELGLAALGYTVPEPLLAEALRQHLLADSRLQLHAPARLHAVHPVAVHPGSAAIGAELADGTVLRGRLLVAADGAASPTRDALGISATQRDLGGMALCASVRTSAPHEGQAYERFLESGPIALLPRAEPHWRNLIWVMPPGQAAAMRRVQPETFLKVLGQRFGSRAGRFVETSRPQAFALTETQAAQIVAPRAVLIANAAHALHPIGAQGLNLGLRDVAALGELLATAARRADQSAKAGHSGAWGNAGDPGDPALLARYARQRADDWQRARQFTRIAPHMFESADPERVALRSLALAGLDLLAPLRRGFTRLAMGLGGGLGGGPGGSLAGGSQSPGRLERGLPL